MKIEVGRRYRVDFHADPVSCDYVSPSGTLLVVTMSSGHERSCAPCNIRGEWTEQTPFEKASDTAHCRQDVWNAALDHAAKILESVSIGGTPMEKAVRVLADEIRKATV